MSEHQFSTIRTADLMDALCSSVDDAREKAAGNQRWLNAIDAAWDHLLQTDAISYDPHTHALRVESASEAGRVYVSNGDCQCAAFAEHNACWHRAAARLVRRAMEMVSAAQAAANARTGFLTTCARCGSSAPKSAHYPDFCVSCAAPTIEANERLTLEGELYDAAIDAGADFCEAQDAAKAGAVAMLPDLMDFAREWDRAALAARIGRAQAAAMARAA